jgi:hypothetical protein
LSSLCHWAGTVCLLYCWRAGVKVSVHCCRKIKRSKKKAAADEEEEDEAEDEEEEDDDEEEDEDTEEEVCPPGCDQVRK